MSELAPPSNWRSYLLGIFVLLASFFASYSLSAMDKRVDSNTLTTTILTESTAAQRERLAALENEAKNRREQLDRMERKLDALLERMR